MPVISKLGQPLGKLVTIAGRCGNGDVLREKAYTDTPIVFVESVDGNVIPQGTWVEIVPFGPHGGGDEESVPERIVEFGNRCELYGYESGEFRGCPSAAMKAYEEAGGGGFAYYGWRFFTDFVVVKVIKQGKDESKKPYPAPRNGP